MAPKGDGNKRNPIRLFTFDSLKTSSSRSSFDKPEHSLGVPESPKPSTLDHIPEHDQGNIAGGTADWNWTYKKPVESPRLDAISLSSLTSSNGPERRVNIRRPTHLNLDTPIAHEDPSLISQSKARWEHLRQHVLPAPSRPTTPPIASPQPSLVTSITLPPRTQLPKPSLFARRFRHVVDQVREVDVDDTRRFADDLQNICWSIRSVDIHKTKVDREPTASSLHLPFMSTPSLATTDGSSLDNLTLLSKKKFEVRRPQSVQSIALYPTFSIRPLYQLLLQHATPSAARPLPASSLPLEAQVLSTLLTPFTSSEWGTNVDDERRSAVEAFDLLTRTWPPSDEVTGVERCLWCCKAALIPSRSRSDVVGLLWGLIVPGERGYLATKPDTFQTLAQGLFSLLPALSHPSTVADAQDDSKVLTDVIDKLCSGRCGDLDAKAVQNEYNVVASPEDKADLLRAALFLDSLSKCLEQYTHHARLWLLQNSLEKNWIRLSKDLSFTPLLAAIHARTLKNLCRALLSLLSVPVDHPTTVSRAQVVTRLLQKKIIPEMDALGNGMVSDARMSVVKILLSLIRHARSSVGMSIICQWYGGSSIWRSSIEDTLRSLIVDGDWSNILETLSLLIDTFPDDPRKPLVAFSLPLLHDRLVDEPPAFPCPSLTNVLDTIARLYPQVFYKVIFSCAASSKEFTIVNHLCAMVVVSKFLPDFWTRDAEMMAFALMSDIGGKKGSEGSTPLSWTKARLGQCILVVELIGRIQAARHEREASPDSGGHLVETLKFALALEARLGILLDVKEQTALTTPPSQRLLFCILFREIRLLTRSLKPATWLSRVISWFIDVHLDDGINPDPEEEEMRTIGQLRGLYAAAQDGVRSPHQRRSTMLLSKALDRPHQPDHSPAGSAVDLDAMFDAKSALLGSLMKGFVGKAMKLLVTMSALLTPGDYQQLGSHLWEQVRSEENSSSTASVCFLLMQCAEKTPLDLLAIMEVDLQSSNNSAKLAALQKISILTNWRFQISSQHVIMDRSHRPFKLARGPLPFVATDIGSSVYVRDEDPNELRDNLPSELRKRLAEIGWDQDDTPVNQQLERIRTPMSLMPTSQLDHLDSPMHETFPASPTSPNPNLTTSSGGDRVEEMSGLLRRNSSTGGPIHGLKRRAVFVPSLTAIFPRLASLVFDPDYTVAFAARGIIMDLMRNDPALLVRPILDLFVGDRKDMQSAMLGINAFLHVQRILPSPMSHYLFNNLAGFLKFMARHSDGTTALEDFAHSVPILSTLVTQVSGMSIREIRRAKIETFLIPSGSLWFTSSAPMGPMFPRSPISARDPFDVLTSDLVSMIMIRTSQNLLFLSMLKRNRQDVQVVRKSMSKLVLPSTGRPFDTENLGFSNFVPHRSRLTEDNASLTGLSLMLSRSYLLLVAQVFRSMPRHLNDRNELAVLIDGLNRVLLTHGDDVGIVGQVMIALMVASTRFRRLFTSGGGYNLVMPAVIKVYAESEGHTGIRLAVEYAVNRFFALHQDTFLFQTLDSITHIAMLPEIQGDWLAKNMYSLFSALRRGVLPSTPDPAGIHNSNKLQEREALIASTAEEKPQTLLALLRRPQGQHHVTIDLPEEYETKRLGIDDLVRLFLTVIAHDPYIARAERFLRLFRYITPYLYHASSSARTVLQDGIDALGVILSRASTKVKPADGPSTREDLAPVEVIQDGEVSGRNVPPSDILSMRLDYLSLIGVFTRAGGQLSQSSALRTIDLVRIMLKDSPSSNVIDTISRFFADFTRYSLLGESTPSVKKVVSFLRDLAPVIGGYMTEVDLTGVLETIATLASNPMYANEPSFSRVVVTQICAAGLSACELAASENLLLLLPSRPGFINLLAQAVYLHGASVTPELEKQTPSYDFLTGIVFPFVMSLKTGDPSDSMPSENRDALISSWIRLLSYSMSACEQSARRALEGPKSQDRGRNDTKRVQRPTFIMALQILKIIVVRAEADLTSHLPGIWARIAAFLKPILGNGDAIFSPRPQDISPYPSPTATPRTSGQFDPFLSTSTGARTSMSSVRPPSSPRAIDYALWSFLELLCLYRNPLTLQMRILVYEKLAELDHELRHQRGTHTPRSRPVSASMFSKARRRTSGFPSPHSSPRLSPSQSFPYDSSFFLDGRQAGYSNPSMSPSNDPHRPKITHLGPISPISAFGRALSTGSTTKGIEVAATEINIKSLTLVCATYRRIRTVQRYMGYEPLLPMPNIHEDSDEVFPTAWTRKQALDAILQETRELIEEFEESERTPRDSVVPKGPFTDPL